MTNNEITAFDREPLPKIKRNMLKEIGRVDYYEFAEYLLLLLLGRSSILGMLNPFGIAFFAAVFPTQKRIFGILFAVIGILWGNFNVLALKYLGSLAIIVTFTLLLGEELSKRPWLYSLIASVSVFINGFIYICFDGLLVYDVLMLLTEASGVFLCTFAFRRASGLLRTIKRRRVFENEETASLVLLSAAVILSISTITYLSSFAHVLSALIIMILSLTAGAAVSTMAGTLLGFVISAQDVLPAQIIGVYALCAMISGLMRRGGKWGVAIGFFLTNALTALYFNSSTVTLITFYSILIAGVVLFFIPERFLSLFGAVAKTPGIHPSDDPVTRTKEVLTNRLLEASDSFMELSGIFKELIEDKINSDVRNIGLVFEQTADSVCKSCSMSRYCWQKNYNRTIDMLEEAFPVMQKRGRAADIDFNKNFRDDCMHFDEFLDTLNRNYEVYKVNLMWSGKVMESRSLVADQFKNISAILKNIRKGLDTDINEDMNLENKVAAALDRKGIIADKICVSGVDGYEVTMIANSCGGNLVCSTTAAAAISEALGVPMLRTARRCSDSVCSLKFREQERFSVDIGICTTTREGSDRSGDNHTYSLLDNGTYVLALSDGMGSGTRANIQSTITVELVKRLLGAGFDKDTALRLINSALLTNGDEETFATVDMCLINLYTGAVEFIKIGAANSYIKSGNELKNISSTSLPAGIVDNAEPDFSVYFAKHSDYIILATDGVTDTLTAAGDEAFKEFLNSFGETTAQKLADAIMLEAIRLSGGRVKDDMTVLCARISEVM